MYFKQRYNCYFRELGPHPDGVILEIAPDQFAKYQAVLIVLLREFFPAPGKSLWTSLGGDFESWMPGNG